MPDDQDLLRPTVRHLVRSSDSAGFVPELLAAGWHEVIQGDPVGAVRVLFNELGRALGAGWALDTVVLDGLGLNPGTHRVLYADPTVVDPRPGPSGLARGGWVDPTEGIVLLEADGSPRSAVLVPGAGLDLVTVRGIDPELELVRVTLLSTEGGRQLSPDRVEAATAASRRAVAEEMLGATAVMLELACAHATDRQQFGRPIGTFQAVRHLLANALVSLRAAQASLDDAWRDGGSDAAVVAKALAGRAASTVGGAAQQVLGGMGFTWEHGLHRHMRRTMALNVLLGSSLTLAEGLGSRIVAERSVPRLGAFAGSAAPPR